MSKSSRILRKHRFSKPVRILDQKDGTVRDVIRFDRHDGTRGRIEAAPADIADARGILKTLRNHDAVLPEESEIMDLLDALAVHRPMKRKTLLTKSGWGADGRYFSVGKRVVGTKPEGAVALGSSALASSTTGRFKVVGSPDEWSTQVSELGAASSLMIFITGAVFAAPLLRPLRMGSFGIVITGPTRIGKSISTLLGATALGYGSDKEFLTWKIKEARLEQLLPLFNDIMLPVDDVMTMGGTPVEKVKRLDELAYGVASGRERERHSSYQKEAGEWISLLVTQGEQSLDKMAGTRYERPGGAAQRFICLPALGTGEKHIFDRGGKGKLDRTTASGRGRLFKRIVEFARKQRGAAFVAYMTRVIAEGRPAIVQAERDVKRAVQMLTDEMDGDEARDLARLMGVVFAGLMRAHAYGLVKWPPAEIEDALRVCYARAREQLHDDAKLLKDGLVELEKTLRELPIVRAKSGGVRQLPPAAEGFRQRFDEHRRFVISCDAFKEVFASKRQRKLVEDWLIESARITMAKREEGQPAPKEQFTWPNRKRRRSYEIIYPVEQDL